MKAVVLSSAPVGHPSMEAILRYLKDELLADHDVVERFDLSSTKLGFCQGEFDCWVKTPGRCRSRDAETAILDAVHDASTLVLFGPATFGGHDHVLKRAVDRLLCLLEPFFEKRSLLTHHATRYPHHQRLFSVAWGPARDASASRTYARLNDANAVNFLAPACGAIVLDDEHEADWADSLHALFAAPLTPGASLVDRASLTDELMEAAAPDMGAVGGAVHRAAILVGSPKPKGSSASELLARALSKRLIAGSVVTELHFANEFVHDNERAECSARAIADCDLFVLATPLYVDAFPSLTTHALELVAQARQREAHPARFAVLINCGFPEAEQNRTALRMARLFADQARYRWAGALPLGGGGMVTAESSLTDPHGPLAHVARALDLASPALAAGGVLPFSAIAAMAKPSIPDAVYRAMGDLGWRWKAYKNDVAQGDLHARPLDGPERNASNR